MLGALTYSAQCQPVGSAHGMTALMAMAQPQLFAQRLTLP